MWNDDILKRVESIYNGETGTEMDQFLVRECAVFTAYEDWNCSNWAIGFEMVKSMRLGERYNEFDAIYASLHGATVTESCEDACGKLTTLLRKLAGDKPVVASFDLHANITDITGARINAMSIYQPTFALKYNANITAKISANI